QRLKSNWLQSRGSNFGGSHRDCMGFSLAYGAGILLARTNAPVELAKIPVARLEVTMTRTGPTASGMPATASALSPDRTEFALTTKSWPATAMAIAPARSTTFPVTFARAAKRSTGGRACSLAVPKQWLPWKRSDSIKYTTTKKDGLR